MPNTGEYGILIQRFCFYCFAFNPERYSQMLQLLLIIDSKVSGSSVQSINLNPASRFSWGLPIEALVLSLPPLAAGTWLSWVPWSCSSLCSSLVPNLTWLLVNVITTFSPRYFICLSYSLVTPDSRLLHR